ncbi:MAG: hypothetical protein AAF202_08600, partial [Pseudomonadota bacterium]
VDVPPEAYKNVPNVNRILSGEYDAYIRDFARAVGEADLPVMMNLYGEFDNNSFYSFGADGVSAFQEDPDVPSGGIPIASEYFSHYGDPELPDGPERVRDSIKRVIDIFRSEGIDVSWFMYASSGFMNVQPTPEQRLFWNTPENHYPGDDYIEWVGKSVHVSSVSDFKNKFELAYEAWGEVTKRPFFIPEQSLSLSDLSVSRASAIKEIFRDYLPGFQRVKAFASVNIAPGEDDLGFGFIPLGGSNGSFTDEITSWDEHVSKNPFWKSND